MKDRSTYYSDLEFSRAEIESGSYKEHLGGGSEEWDQRGEFQLQLLQELGIEKHHKMLDVGCGPGRASRFFVDFLEPNRYWGVDYQPTFIEITRHVMRDTGLDKTKSPVIEMVENFNYPFPEIGFDLCYLFSVLNWCKPDDRCLFFRSAVSRLSPSGRILFSHGGWFEPSYLWGVDLKVNRVIDKLNLNEEEYGWPKGQLFPVIEVVPEKS